ncbi:MAG TPA: electron transport complex subunit RsxA [Pseudomonadales bacterium]|jgi:electron transport complex protein RnfA|nr:electron transport complex subunit RsxA [Gammaproteobacteria bacterium]MDP6024482.1 electron transport complex subunit RsxA [Pseudomonadales bacterium]MDP6316905.1 electron transport complex subunit RsxA [Pseudomonadales bacterium]MDP7313866.1 electron transport complex subunit RsxA [Pseudomonadales bacterium]HJP51927.1 electron transport complex subunit RsxA [Pseudomonadales bacterium]|tara:strand:+ start:184 stop:759 length:576 start_codon:yes stop_codon:yes gene_type:complete
MPEPIVILLGTIFVNNFVMVQFLGLCPFFGATQKLDAAIGMAATTTFVLTLASALSFLVEHYLLIPFGLQYLRIITFIVLIATLVQFSEIVIRTTQPMLHQVLGVFIPLITTNCAVLGVALLNIRHTHSFQDSVTYGLGAALGFSFLLIVFAAMRERLADAKVPRIFQGTAINIITAGLLSLAFMGFTGMH